MKKIAYFILIAILLAGYGGCSRQRDNTNIAVDKLVSVNGEIEQTSQPALPEETEQKVDEIVNATPQLVNNEGIIDSQTERSNESTNIKSINSENVNKENTSNQNVRNETTDINDKSNVNPDNNSSDKNVTVEKQGLVELIKLDDSFVIDIKYATGDNFAKKRIYTMPLCLIHKNTAQKLIAANSEFKTLGYRIKVFDAYRPYSAQQVLWDAAEDKSYVANPKKGSVHNRGAAVDVTLVDESGQELGMPSGYDEFSECAHLEYNQCDEELIKNRELLGKIMEKHGFKRISTEWWHFDDTDSKNYPLLDIAFEEFIQVN